MAARDIEVYTSPMGGHTRVAHFPLSASETFDAGGLVAVDAAGQLTESADDAVDADLMGIALGGPGPAPTNTNPATGAAWAENDLCPVIIPDSNTYFVTSNFATDGAGTQAAPAVANIGDEAGFTLASGVWSVDVGATNNLARIMDVLNSQKESIRVTGETLAATDTFYVVFVIVAHQSVTLGTADAPVA